MKNSKFFIWLLISFLFVIFHSCSQFEKFEEIEGFEIQGDYALPIFNSTSTLLEFLEISDSEILEFITIDNGNLAFAYEGEGPTVKQEEIFEDFPDFPLAIPYENTSVELDLSEDFELEEMLLRQGTLSFTIRSQVERDIIVTLFVNSLTKNGQVFSLEVEIPHNGNQNNEYQINPQDISGYTLQLENGFLNAGYNARYASDALPVDIIGISGEAQNWKYEYIEGNFAYQKVETDMESLEIDLFDLGFKGEYELADPSVNIELRNSFGLALRANVEALYMLNEEGERLDLSGTLQEEGFLLAPHTDKDEGTFTTSVLTLNTSNSNIAELLSIQPNKVYYQLSYEINPDITDTNGFISQHSEVNSYMNVLIPAIASLNLTNQEYSDLDFGQPDELTAAEFKLITENNVPLSFEVQFYIVDYDGNLLDSLFNESTQILTAAQVDNEGNTIAPVVTTTLIPVKETTLPLLNGDYQLLSDLRFMTPDNGNTIVKMRPDQQVTLKLGAKFTVAE